MFDNPYLKENYRLVSIDVSKQLVLDADARAIQHINFTGDLKLDTDDGKPLMFFVLEEVKNIIYDFLQRTVKVL